MFRDKKPNNAVKLAWRVPWWRTCESCDREFWWERAWVGWWTVCRSMPPKSAVSWHVWHKGFVCAQCSADSKSAVKFFGVRKPKRPVCSPAPPSPAPPVALINRIVKDFGV